jgi:hypothetical protein
MQSVKHALNASFIVPDEDNDYIDGDSPSTINKIFQWKNR